ncbi:hypothetical protein DFH06DRAFT_1189463 [Mycena polygramma]|nr:hypothetical protein DFH06DRAFT_1189463 [Mycena polygramma]
MDPSTPPAAPVLSDPITNVGKAFEWIRRPNLGSFRAARTRVTDIVTSPPPRGIEFDPYKEYPFEPPTSYSESFESSQKSTIKDADEPDESEQPILGYGMTSDERIRLGPSRRFNLTIAFPALLTSLLAAGAASLLLGWLLSRRVTADGDTAFHNALVAAETRQSNSSNVSLFSKLFGADQGENSNEGSRTVMYGLAMSSFAAHLVSFTTPFVLSVFAYLLASMWLQDQIHGHIASLPTPTQYGHLVGLCGSFGLASLFDTAKYLSRRRRERVAASTTLITAFFAALVALVMNYALSLSDLWLHTTTTSFSYQFISPMPSSMLPELGFQINTTLCPGPAPFMIQYSDTWSNCLHFQPFNEAGETDMEWGSADLINEGAAVVGNISFSSQIQLIGNLSILVPKNLPGGVDNMVFDTFAMEATCSPVTDCLQNTNIPGTDDLHSLACMSFTPPFVMDITGAMPMLDQFNVSNNALIFESGSPGAPRTSVGPPGNESAAAGYAQGSDLNPAGVLSALYWESDSGINFKENATPGVYGSAQAPTTFTFFVSSCVLDVWDVSISYSAPLNGSSPSFTLASPLIRTNFTTTSALLAALDTAYSATLAAYITTTLEASEQVESDLFHSFLSKNVSHGILGYAAPLTERISSLRGNQVTTGTVSRYPLGPLGMVLALTYGYALLALGVGIAVFTLPSREIIVEDGAGRPTPQRIREIDLMHLRLTSARACVADRFDGGNASEPMLEISRDSIFKETGPVRRLGGGFVHSEAELYNDDGESSVVTRRDMRRFKVDTVDNLQSD